MGFIYSLRGASILEAFKIVTFYVLYAVYEWYAFSNYAARISNTAC